MSGGGARIEGSNVAAGIAVFLDEDGIEEGGVEKGADVLVWEWALRCCCCVPFLALVGVHVTADGIDERDVIVRGDLDINIETIDGGVAEWAESR